MQPNDSDFGPEDFASHANVSRETLARLKLYAGMLVDWNTRQNLVSRESVNQMWLRHFWDSAQLAEFIPRRAATMVDLGSGAGFPGLVLAEILRDRGMRVVLYNSTLKKREFLQAVGRRLGLDIKIRGDRIETVMPEAFDVIVARACAPLATLLGYAHRFWGENTVGLFAKGQNLGPELTEAHKYWNMQVQKHPSKSSPTGIVLEIRELKDVAAGPSTVHRA